MGKEAAGIFGVVILDPNLILPKGHLNALHIIAQDNDTESGPVVVTVSFAFHLNCKGQGIACCPV